MFLARFICLLVCLLIGRTLQINLKFLESVDLGTKTVDDLRDIGTELV